MAQRVGRGIAPLFHDRGTRRGWVVSSTPRPHFTPRKDPVPILQEAGWAPGPVWTGGKSRPHRDSIPDRPARSQSLYRLSYPARGIVLHAYFNEARVIRDIITGQFHSAVHRHRGGKFTIIPVHTSCRNFIKNSTFWTMVEPRLGPLRRRPLLCQCSNFDS